MGDVEILLSYVWTFILGVVIYNIITIFFWRNLHQRFGTLKSTRRDFYECGFRPQNQKPVMIPLQFLLIAIFFLMYDVELVFLFPLSSGIGYTSFWDIIIFIFFFTLFIVTLAIDYDRHALSWQY